MPDAPHADVLALTVVVLLEHLNAVVGVHPGPVHGVVHPFDVEEERGLAGEVRQTPRLLPADGANAVRRAGDDRPRRGDCQRRPLPALRTVRRRLRPGRGRRVRAVAASSRATGRWTVGVPASGQVGSGGAVGGGAARAVGNVVGRRPIRGLQGERRCATQREATAGSRGRRTDEQRIPAVRAGPVGRPLVAGPGARASTPAVAPNARRDTAKPIMVAPHSGKA